MFFRFDISASGLLQDKKEYVEPLFTENKYAGLVYVAMPWFEISAVGSKYFTYSSYKPCIVSEKYYLCNVLIQPKAPMGRGWADIMEKAFLYALVLTNWNLANSLTSQKQSNKERLMRCMICNSY